MRRLRRILRLASLVTAVALAGYVGLGVAVVLAVGGYLISDWAMWPDFLPVVPIWALGLAFVVLNLVDAGAYAVGRMGARRARRRALAATEAWLAGPGAATVATTGDPDAGVSALRAHPVEDGVELLWDNPAASFERVVVVRSSDGYATGLHDEGQTPLYRGKGLRLFDSDVAEGHVYFYSVFIVSGDGAVSPPAWVPVVIANPSLVGRLSRRLSSTASAVTLYGADFKRFRRGR